MLHTSFHTTAPQREGVVGGAGVKRRAEWVCLLVSRRYANGEKRVADSM